MRAEADHADPAKRAGMHVADRPVGVVAERVDRLDRHHRAFEGRHAVEGQRDTIMRRIGSVRSLSQAPDKVIRPLIMPPQDGIHSMMEKTMPKVCAQSGSSGVVQVMRASPDVEKDQGPEVHDRQPVGIDRAFGLLGHEVIHHAEEAGGQEEADGVMAVPPLGQRILDPGEQRIALGAQEGDRHGQIVDDVQHGDGDDEGR